MKLCRSVLLLVYIEARCVIAQALLVLVVALVQLLRTGSMHVHVMVFINVIFPHWQTRILV
jgi:uncharacterized protein (DUF1810 family)